MHAVTITYLTTYSQRWTQQSGRATNGAYVGMQTQHALILVV